MLRTERLRTFVFLLELIKSISLTALRFFYSISRVLQLATQRASEKLAKISLDVYNTELSDFAYPSSRPIAQLGNLSNKTKIYKHRLKHSSQDIQDIEELLQLVMDATQIEICNWCLLTNKIIPLQNYKRLLDLDSSNAAKISKSFLESIHPDDYKSVTQTILRCIEEKIDYNDEFRVVSPTGKIHWIFARGKIYFNENGKATKITLILTNINDRWQAETSAINSETKWRSLIQYSSEFVTVIGWDNNNFDWTIKFVSFSIQRILGYVPFKLLGEKFLNLVHSSDLPHVITSLQQVLCQSDRVIVMKYKYLGKTGNWYLIESSASNHFNNSTIIGIVLNSRIVKELTHAELFEEDGSRAITRGVKY